MSLKLRFSCGMALLVCTRCYWHVGGTPKEGIHKVAGPEQIFKRPDELRTLRSATGEVRPFRGDQRLASVWQDENELQAAAHVRVPQDLQGLSFEGVMRAGDDHSLREVPTVGSVWWFPLTPFHTAN
jgi:hypothetical protein